MKKLTLMLGVAAVCGGMMTSAPVRAETYVLQTENRVMLSDWVIAQNRGCPIGSVSVKKEHLLRDPSYRCMVPKTSKMVVYQPGTAIPSTVTYTNLPEEVTLKLPAPPKDQIYVSSDNNVYLIKRDNRTVVESVTVVGPSDDYVE